MFTITLYDNTVHRSQVIPLWENVFGYEAAHKAPAQSIDKKVAVYDGLFFIALVADVIKGIYDMDIAQFWSLIEQSRQGGLECAAQADRLSHLLTALPPEEIYAFDNYFAQRRFQAYRWDLWGVAYLINGGCSDDGFEYFCCWLIGQGQAAYERALERPASIGDLVEDDAMENADEQECEDLLYVAAHAYERVTGTNMPPRKLVCPAEPAGARWEPHELEQRFPDLWARF